MRAVCLRFKTQHESRERVEIDIQAGVRRAEGWIGRREKARAAHQRSASREIEVLHFVAVAGAVKLAAPAGLRSEREIHAAHRERLARSCAELVERPCQAVGFAVRMTRGACDLAVAAEPRVGAAVEEFCT